MTDITHPRRARITAASLVTAALIVAFAVGCAVFGGPAVIRQLVSGLMLGSIYMMVAVAFTLTIGVLNFLNFTIPTLFMLTGMVAWGFIAKGYVNFADGWAWLVALVCGIAVAVLASLLVERFTFRYLKIKHGDAIEHAIPLASSLGFLLIFEHLVLISLGSESHRFFVPFKADLHVGNMVIGVPQLVSSLFAIVTVAGLSFVLKKTGTGRALRTIAESADTALLLGVETKRLVPVVFILTGVMAGLAGALFTINYREVSPFMGDNVGTKAIAAMVLGGLGSIWGSIVGGLIVGVIETLSIYYFGGDSVQMVVWGALLLIIILRPQGLLGAAIPAKSRL